MIIYFQNDNYKKFINTKNNSLQFQGISIGDSDIHPFLYDFQKAVVKWACRKSRAAVFADCGLGKTVIQLEWARLMGGRSLIVAPLCVAQQTIKEAEKIDLSVNFARTQHDLTNGINITNYEMVEKIGIDFNSIVLDESSILKSLAGKTRRKLINLFQNVPHRLCCTATPCPNDIAELGNHSEFLGYLTHPEMLASFFVNKADKGMGWVMKGYAHDAFYKWLASWAVCINSPDDLGFDGSLFNLPPIQFNHIEIKSNYTRPDELFFTGLKGIQDRATIRKMTVDDRINAVVKMVNNSNGNQWICWCGLNDEANKLQKLIPDKSVNVQGSDSLEKKESAIWDFIEGKTKVLITKSKIAGFGLNLQNACNMAFVGLSDSYESYYQCIRRSWRFGQKQPVNVNIVLTDIEYEIFANVKRKEMEAGQMSAELIKNIDEFQKEEVIESQDIKKDIKPIKYSGKNWDLWQGDCVEVTANLKENLIDFSIYSPPFLSLYTYSASDRDIGNSKNDKEFFVHYQYLINNLLNITKPGRNTAVHVSQIPAMMVRDGYIGLKDFRGDIVRAYQKGGWIYDGEIVIQKNPQSQAVRTKSKALLFVQMKRDASWLRPGLADYVLKFRKPGENKIPITPDDISNNDWIAWAHPIWTDIRENHTLNKAAARSDKDEKHICPLQLDVIDRCIRLWSNRGELVFSPFAGIGSEGYQSILNGRDFLGIELKPEYIQVAIGNLEHASNIEGQPLLFLKDQL